MSTRKHDAGPSNTDPATVAPTADVHLSVRATGEPDAAQWRAVEAAANSFHTQYLSLLNELLAVCCKVRGDGPLRNPSVAARHKVAAGQYAALLRQFPIVTDNADPDVIDAGLAADAALTVVTREFQETIPLLEACARQAARHAWSGASVIRSTAKVHPKKPTTLVAQITTIESGLRQGKRVTTSANAAARAKTVAMKAQQRAARALAKAESAAVVAERVAQGHAANHPSIDKITQPAEPTTTPETPTKNKPKG